MWLGDEKVDENTFFSSLICALSALHLIEKAIKDAPHWAVFLLHFILLWVFVCCCCCFCTWYFLLYSQMNPVKIKTNGPWHYNSILAPGPLHSKWCICCLCVFILRTFAFTRTNIIDLSTSCGGLKDPSRNASTSYNYLLLAAVEIPTQTQRRRRTSQ